MNGVGFAGSHDHGKWDVMAAQKPQPVLQAARRIGFAKVEIVILNGHRPKGKMRGAAQRLRKRRRIMRILHQQPEKDHTDCYRGRGA